MRATTTELNALSQPSLAFVLRNNLNDPSRKYFDSQHSEQYRPHGRWLTVPEAAPELGISENSLRTMCNGVPPRIEHKREGTRGRSGKGTILIERSVIEAHNAKRRFTAPEAAEIVPLSLRKRNLRFASPHLQPEKYGLA
jgi:hypothetical protein